MKRQKEKVVECTVCHRKMTNSRHGLDRKYCLLCIDEFKRKRNTEYMRAYCKTEVFKESLEKYQKSEKGRTNRIKARNKFNKANVDKYVDRVLKGIKAKEAYAQEKKEWE